MSHKVSDHQIDCTQAVSLNNQKASLTFEERELLNTHLANCYQCREEQLCCAEALQLIDQLPPAEADCNQSLNLHISCCPECLTAKLLEPTLRVAVAPICLPTPSLNFEALLKSKLSIAPLSESVPVKPDIIVQEAPISQWSWVIAAITLALTISAQLPKVYSLIASIPNLTLKFVAFLASHLTGETAVVYSLLKRSYSSFTVENLGPVMVITLIAISLSAMRFVLLQDD